MLKKVVYVALLVSDQDKALDFYTNVVGFEKRGDYRTPDGPRFLTIGIKGQDFELVLWPGTPGKAEAGSAAAALRSLSSARRGDNTSASSASPPSRLRRRRLG